MNRLVYRLTYILSHPGWDTEIIPPEVVKAFTKLDFEHLDFRNLPIAWTRQKTALDFFNVLGSGRYAKSLIAFDSIPTLRTLSKICHVQSPAKGPLKNKFPTGFSQKSFVRKLYFYEL